MTLRTDSVLEQALEALVEREGLSRQEIVRRAVLERYERSGQADRVTEAGERLADPWGDVLERLGTVGAVEHLDVEDRLRLTRILGAGPVRDLGLLDTAANRPQASAFGEDAYPTTAIKAAALLHSVVSSHPLVDGNKRLGWLACVVLLDLFGLRPDLTDEDALELVVSVAEGRLDDVAAVADVLRCTEV